MLVHEAPRSFTVDDGTLALSIVTSSTVVLRAGGSSGDLGRLLDPSRCALRRFTVLSVVDESICVVAIKACSTTTYRNRVAVCTHIAGIDWYQCQRLGSYLTADELLADDDCNNPAPLPALCMFAWAW